MLTFLAIVSIVALLIWVGLGYAVLYCINAWANFLGNPVMFFRNF